MSNPVKDTNSSTPTKDVESKKESFKKTEKNSMEAQQINGADGDLNNAPQSSNTSRNPKNIYKKDESLIRTVNSRDEFDELVKTIKEKYILVWFFANWCGPCKVLGMKFLDLAEKYRNQVEVLKVDVDDFEDLALENEVTTMPSFMIMLNGKKLAQYFGTKQEQIDEIVEKYLMKAS